MIAINQMDELFRQGNYDSHYMTRREQCDDHRLRRRHAVATRIRLLDEDGGGEKGYDILLTDIGDDYVVDAATDKGKALLAHGQGREPQPTAGA